MRMTTECHHGNARLRRRGECRSASLDEAFNRTLVNACTRRCSTRAWRIDMPVFGDYETIGGPWFMSGRRRQTRSYWQATNRVLQDGRVYFIKSIAVPGPESSPESAQERTAQGPPVADLGPDFFESVTRLKAAYRAHPDTLAPIHAFGRTDTEVWYATDLYPRNSLSEFEPSPADISHRTLEHVVSCVARGCLALQQATGRSHGNLNASNVLLDGEPGPLRRTRLRLIDPAGSAPKGIQGWPAADVRTATEVRDLRGIGEIILELVESNPIDGPEDYTLPIEHSAPWGALGKNSQRWLDLCNRLLDPDLSLEEMSLESLAKDMRPRQSRFPMFFAGLSLLALLAFASYPFWAAPLKQATQTWSPDARTVASAEPPAPSLTDSASPVAEVVRPAELPSRLNTENPAAPSETDHLGRQDLAADSPSTSQRVAAIPANANADAGVDPVGSNGQTISIFSPAEIASPTSGIDLAASPVTTQGSNSNSGVPAGSSTGSVASNARGMNPKDTASAPQTTISEPVSSVRPPAPSNPQRTAPGRSDTASAAKTDTPKPNPPQTRQARELVPAERTGKPVAVVAADRPRAVRPAQQTAKGARSQAELGRSIIGRRQTPEKLPSSKQPPRIDIVKLDRQMRDLESDVAKVVALRRSSDLFARVDALEAQYAKANRLSAKTKNRFDLLRLNMAKKLPGPPPERPSVEPFIPPVVGK